MPSHSSDELFNLDDLDLGPLTVMGMRDSVALPETGASNQPYASSSCSCCYQVPSFD